MINWFALGMTALVMGILVLAVLIMATSGERRIPARDSTCGLCGHPESAHEPPCSDCVHAWESIPCHADFRIIGKR